MTDQPLYTPEELSKLESSFQLIEKHTLDKIVELHIQDNMEDAYYLKNALLEMNYLLTRLHS